MICAWIPMYDLCLYEYMYASAWRWSVCMSFKQAPRLLLSLTA